MKLALDPFSFLRVLAALRLRLKLEALAALRLALGDVRANELPEIHVVAPISVSRFLPPKFRTLSEVQRFVRRVTRWERLYWWGPA